MIRHSKFFSIGFASLLLVAGTVTAGDAEKWTLAWLFAFVLISMVPIGSLALLLAHGITGGRWGTDLAPALVPAARAIPLLLLPLMPVLATRGGILPLSGAAPHATQFYLNPFFFDARSIIAILIWSLFAWLQIWRRPMNAAFGLVVHIILISLIPADWILTIAPGSTSAGFGLGFGIEQMFAALAFAALLLPPGSGQRTVRDLSGLTLTTLLGSVYFIYMQFLISWYGNIPDKVKWYAARSEGLWPMLALAAFALGAALPFVAILNAGIRRSTAALRWVGLCALIGIALHVAWLTVPVGGGLVLVPAFLSAAALAIFLIATGASMRPAIGRSAA